MIAISGQRQVNRYLAAANSTNVSYGSLGFAQALPANVVVNQGDFPIIWPFAVGSDNTTFTMRVVGVRPDNSGNYYSFPLADFTCQTCTDVGDAGGAVLNTERYCDTITANYGSSSNIIVQPTTNVRGFIVPDVFDCPFYYLDFVVTTVTSCNALVATITSKQVTVPGG